MKDRMMVFMAANLGPATKRSSACAGWAERKVPQVEFLVCGVILIVTPPASSPRIRFPFTADISYTDTAMKGFLLLIGTSAAGWIGWWLCEDTHLMIQYAVSVIASGVGYYYTKKFVEKVLGL